PPPHGRRPGRGPAGGGRAAAGPGRFGPPVLLGRLHPDGADAVGLARKSKEGAKGADNSPLFQPASVRSRPPEAQSRRRTAASRLFVWTFSWVAYWLTSRPPAGGRG